MHPARSVWLFIGFLLAYTTLLSAQSTYKYSYMPKNVYKNQLFPVTVIGVGESDTQKAQFNFDTSSKIQPLFKEPLIVQNGQDSLT